MNETELQDRLYDLLENLLVRVVGEDLPDELPEELRQIDDVRRFADEGLLTNNKGLVLHMQDGREFQITIVRSK